MKVIRSFFSCYRVARYGSKFDYEPQSLIWVGYFAEFTSRARTILLNFLIISSVILIFWMVYLETQRKLIFITPFKVPESLVKRGYSSEFISNKMGGRILETSNLKLTGFKDYLFAIQGKQTDVQIPGSGISYRTLVNLAKEYLNLSDPSVSGELFEEHNYVAINIVVNKGNKIETITLKNDTGNIDELLIAAGDSIQQNLNPILMARYFGYCEEKRCAGQKYCDFSKSFEIFQTILEGDQYDDFKYALNGYAYYLTRLDRNADAADKAKAATELDKKFTAAYVNWGNALLKLSFYNEAIEKYEIAARLDLKCHEALNNWGTALLKIGRYDEAIEKFESSTKLNPRCHEAFSNWGNALMKVGKPNEAIEKYRHAIILNPKKANSYNGWGNALFCLGRYDEAIEKYYFSMILEPSNVETFRNWSNTLLKLGRSDEAFKKLEYYKRY